MKRSIWPRSICAIALSLGLGAGAVFAACQACFHWPVYVEGQCLLSYDLTPCRFLCPNVPQCKNFMHMVCSFTSPVQRTCSLVSGPACCPATALLVVRDCDDAYDPS